MQNSEDAEIMKFSLAAKKLMTVRFGAAKPAAHSKDTVLVLPKQQNTLKIQSWCGQNNRTLRKYRLGAAKTTEHSKDTVLVLPKQQNTLKIQSWCYQNNRTL
jgi:hypothetical protein